jgi:hypothetical protein
MPMIAATKIGLGTVRSVRMPLPALHANQAPATESQPTHPNQLILGPSLIDID